MLNFAFKNIIYISESLGLNTHYTVQSCMEVSRLVSVAVKSQGRSLGKFGLVGIAQLFWANDFWYLLICQGTSTRR